MPNKEKSVDLSAKAKKTDEFQADDNPAFDANEAETLQRNSKSDLNEPVEVEELGSDEDEADGDEDNKDGAEVEVR